MFGRPENARKKGKRLAAGYLRWTPGCGSFENHNRVIQEYYWNNCKEYDWYGFIREREKSRTSPMLSRKGYQQLIKQLDRGDLVLVPWFGNLCMSIDDALEGLPSLLGQGIRIFCVGDNFELSEEYYPFLRALRRDWYLNPLRDTPAPIGSRKTKRTIQYDADELLFMQTCYRLHCIDGKPNVVVFRKAKKQWPTHPRYKTPLSPKQIENAVKAYHDIVAQIALGQRMPKWIERAQEAGFFTETLDDMTKSRAAQFYRLAKSLNK